MVTHSRFSLAILDSRPRIIMQLWQSNFHCITIALLKRDDRISHPHINLEEVNFLTLAFQIVWCNWSLFLYSHRDSYKSFCQMSQYHHNKIYQWYCWIKDLLDSVQCMIISYLNLAQYTYVGGKNTSQSLQWHSQIECFTQKWH